MKPLSKVDQIGKKKAKGKKGKTERKRLVDKLDALVSLKIRMIDGGHPWDSCKGAVCNNHLITRANHRVRWFPMNCFTGTTGANYRHEQNPHIMIAWFIGRYGKDEYQYLIDLSIGVAKFNISELNDMVWFWENVKAKDIRETLVDRYFNEFRRFAPEDYEFEDDFDYNDVADDRPR